MNDHKGILQVLFDFTFEQKITLRLIKFLYFFGTLASAFGAFYLLIISFGKSFFLGLLALVISPVVFFIYLIITRVFLEIIWVLFDISENIRKLANPEDVEKTEE